MWGEYAPCPETAQICRWPALATSLTYCMHGLARQSRLASHSFAKVDAVPEDSLEASEIKEKLDEAIERMESGEQARTPKWMVYLSLATALMAVFAAIASLEAGAHSNEAIFEKNEAVLRQSQASDRWSYYQAKGIKATFLQAQSQSLPPASSDVAQRLAQQAAHYSQEQAYIENTAKKLEEQVAESNLRATAHIGRHHRFAISVTVFQVAIALSAIAALTRRPLLFWVGLAGGVVGAILFAFGFA